MKRFSALVTALVVSMVVSVPASGALITYTAPMTDFTYDSDTQSAAFQAALGGGYTHISFLGASNTDGASYSPVVTFSSKAGIFGGSNTSLVNASGEIGPSGTWDGILNIDFLANGNTVAAVGFGLVEFDSSAEIIRVYDELDNLIGTFNDQLTGAGIFSMWGVAGNAGERIGRIELDGNFFAIQDIAFNASPFAVPEPGSLALLGFALAGLGFARRRRGAR